MKDVLLTIALVIVSWCGGNLVGWWGLNRRYHPFTWRVPLGLNMWGPKRHRD